MGSTFNRCSHWKAAKSSSTPSLAPSATHWRKSSLASDSGKSLIVSSNHGLLAIFLRRRQLRRLEGRGCAVIELYPSSKIYSIRRLSFFFSFFFFRNYSIQTSTNQESMYQRFLFRRMRNTDISRAAYLLSSQEFDSTKENTRLHL